MFGLFLAGVLVVSLTLLGVIDISTEKVVSFREAARYCPRRRRGRKPSVSTFYRWRDQGLETIRVGSQLCTSVQALQRFFNLLTASDKEQNSDPGRRRALGPAAERRRQDRVEQELKKLGL